MITLINKTIHLIELLHINLTKQCIVDIYHTFMSCSNEQKKKIYIYLIFKKQNVEEEDKNDLASCLHVAVFSVACHNMACGSHYIAVCFIQIPCDNYYTFHSFQIFILSLFIFVLSPSHTHTHEK